MSGGGLREELGQKVKAQSALDVVVHNVCLLHRLDLRTRTNAAARAENLRESLAVACD